ncbi:hypothetical protein PM082_011368 [Marasmius tenuissimus]|nr:hypothetical protein PM082_011368 [Marasmius tenuissimus]
MVKDGEQANDVRTLRELNSFSAMAIDLQATSTSPFRVPHRTEIPSFSALDPLSGISRRLDLTSWSSCPRRRLLPFAESEVKLEICLLCVSGVFFYPACIT